MMKLIRILISLIAIAVLVLLLFYGWLETRLDEPLALEQNTVIELRPGGSIRELATTLSDRGLLTTPTLFRLSTRLKGIDTRLKAGEYELQPGDSLNALLVKMVQGSVKQYSITLIEGLTFKQMWQSIQSHPQISHTIDDADKVMALLGKPELHPEGQFLPDTYFIHRNTSDIELLHRAHAAMQMVLDDLWQKRQPDLPLDNPYQALILASIVEKESAVAAERPVIAGVFINRLRKGMRLQTDPTVIYGMGEDYDGDIRFRDLRRDTPYNTYTRKGLPPTPIAMPGYEAIEAALNPEQTDYLYFVAMSDGSGRHVFTSTLAEHNKQVDKHQRGK